MFSALYNNLLVSSESERQAATAQIITLLGEGNPDAFAAMLGLCNKVIQTQNALDRTADDALPREVFTATSSANLLRSRARVSGYVRALSRVPAGIETAIDAGCGSTAILAIATAVLHPDARIRAADIHEPSLRCARKMVELCGLEDRIEVIKSNVLTDRQPFVDLAVTETFASGLTVERGQDITARLSTIANEILPAAVILSATDSDDPDRMWQPCTTIDLSDPGKYAEGSFRASGTGVLPISVYAGFYDARGDSVITRCGSNNLTMPVKLGEVKAIRQGAEISFSYRMGTELHQEPPQLSAT